MKYVVGIGNPEDKYRGTRHNIGFRAADDLAGEKKWQHNASLQAEICEPQEGVWLLKPQTYVNLTGRTVSLLKERFLAQPAEVLVVCDDVNLVFGKLRLRSSGSSGGHHGLENVIQEFGSDAFSRLRIGVGSEKMPKDLAGFVLQRFGKEEEKLLPEVMAKAVSICRAWILEGYTAAEKELSRLQSNQQEKS